MDNKKSFARFWHIAIAFVLVILTIAASAGCINFGASNHEPFYIVVGILNLGWCYPVIRQAVKYINQSNIGE